MKKIVRSDVSDYADSDVVPLNPVDNVPQTVGELLRTKREEFGVDLREAAEYLNIRYAYLLAIEEGRVDDLPGAAYAMGFVRAFADYLGLDGPAIVERYKDETAELGDDVRLVFPSPLPEGKVPSGAIILIGLLALVLVYAGWVVFAQQNLKIAELVPALPAQFSSLLGSDESADTPPEAPPAVADAALPEPVQTPVKEPQAAAPQISDVSPRVSETPIVDRAQPADATPTTDSNPEALAVAQPEPEPSRVVADAAETALKEPVSEPASDDTRGAQPAQNAATHGETASGGAAAVNGSDMAGVPSVAQPGGEGGQGSARTDTTSSGAASSETTSIPSADTSRTTGTPVPQPAIPADQVDTPAAPVEAQEASVTTPLPPKPPALASAEPRQYGDDSAEARVIIKARVDSWVQIRNSEGKRLLSRLLRSGDSYRVPNAPGLLMETGNAGGLEISVDGSVIPDIGPKGGVRRGIALDAESLKAGGVR